MHYRILEHAANLVEDPLRSMIAHKINAFKKKNTKCRAPSYLKKEAVYVTNNFKAVLAIADRQGDLHNVKEI